MRLLSAVALLDDIRGWAWGRAWWWRAPVLYLAALWSLPVLVNGQYRDGFPLFDFISFHVHEGGHVYWSLLGSDWLAIFGGTASEVLLPILAGALMVRSKDWFGVAFCAMWLASTLGGVSVYMGDARALELDLVSTSPDPGAQVDDDPFAGHDWRYLFGHAGLLAYDTRIAAATRALAWGIWWGAMAFSLWLFFVMWRSGATDAVKPGAPDDPSPPGASPSTPAAAGRPTKRYRLR